MFPVSSSVVALDANVLFGYPLRDTLLYAAEADVYRPAWSDAVWEEVARNLQDPRRKRPHTTADVQRLLDALKRSFPDAFIDGYQALAPAIPVNPKDQHVVAMAVRAGAQVLVTYNLRHFPAAALVPYGIEARHPDAFLYDLYLGNPLTMVDVVRAQAAALAHPPMTPQQILDALEQAHIRLFARAIRAHIE